MDGRRLTVAMVLIIAVTVAFTTAPVLSGEHPWNSDQPVGGDGVPGGTESATVTYDTIVVPSTTVVSGTLISSENGMSVWIVILTIVWPTSWAW